MLYYYLIYTVLFLYFFLLNSKGKIDIRMLSGVRHSNKKIFIIEVATRLCFLLLISMLVFEAMKNGLEFNLFATSFQVLSLLLFYISKRTMKESWATNIKSSQKLVASGLFKYSRNPVYVAFFLLYFSTLFINYRLFIYVFLAFIICFHLLVLQEEKFLRKEFGAEYEEYCKNVRRYI